MSLPALDKSSVFLLEALVVWMALCLPGNIVTLVLYNRANSGGDEGAAAAEADNEVSEGVVQKILHFSCMSKVEGVQCALFGSTDGTHA